MCINEAESKQKYTFYERKEKMTTTILAKLFRSKGNCSWKDAQSWLSKNAKNHNITDSTFYKERKKQFGGLNAGLHTKLAPKSKKSRVLGAMLGEKIIPESDFSYADLQKVVVFAKEMGGMARLKLVVDLLAGANV